MLRTCLLSLVCCAAAAGSSLAAQSAPTFHAEGSEPYWTLAIEPAAATVTWGLLGEDDRTLEYAAPLPADTTGRTRYYFPGTQRLKATFTEVPCQDAATGNVYPYTAEVNVAGVTYAGCATRED